MADVEVTCFRCKTGFAVPAETTRAVCPNCQAIGRWFHCDKCNELVAVWARKDRHKWQYKCPSCRRNHWVTVERRSRPRT
jgi:DNA-directed RNA polymerase subunit RPC12/RpoP